VIDDTELKEIQSFAEPIEEQVEAGQYDEAFSSYFQTLKLVKTYLSGINLYNFLVIEARKKSTDKLALNGEYFVKCMLSLCD